MRFSLKKALATTAVVATVATVAPFIGGVPSAFAATNNGVATINPTSGNSGTNFTLGLGSNPVCPGDSANGGYRIQSFMIPASADIDATLTFSANGPTAVGGEFRQPLFSTTGSPYVTKLTDLAVAPAVTGGISGLPQFNWGSVFGPGNVPAGEYSIGIACTLGQASATQLKSYWVKAVTVTTAAPGTGGPAEFNWAQGVKPLAPVLTSPLGAGDGTLTASFTQPGTPDPVVTGYTATATPVGGGAAVTQSGAASPITIAGLANGTAYNVTVHSTNAVNNSVESNTVAGTPTPPPRPAVTNLTATPGVGNVVLNWTAPAAQTPALTGYNVVVSPAVAGSPFTVAAGTTTLTVTGTPGTAYNFTVTPLYPAPYTALPASTTAAPNAAQILYQDITVTRPNGGLVLTQVCGNYGALPADAASLGFPAGLPAAAAAAGGTAPTLAAGGGATDPVFGEYPYPTLADGTPNPTYPTHCAINLGNAQFVKSGAGAGQFFAADGRLNQVTVVDTRDSDPGFNVVGSVSNFTAGAGKSFSGSQLGWTPVKTSTTPGFTDSLNNSYTQTANAGGVIAPNSAVGAGLSSPHTLLTAPALAGASPTFTGGLGIAVADARLKLLIPVTAQNGNYTAVLTISAI